jgi:hypothetical protein
MTQAARGKVDLVGEARGLLALYGRVTLLVHTVDEGLRAQKRWLDMQQAAFETPGLALLLCDDQSDVGAHLVALIREEQRQARHLAPVQCEKRVLDFLRGAPKVSYAAALRLVAHFRGRRLQHILAATPAELAAALPWYSEQQCRNLAHYFSRAFDKDTLA